MPRRPNSANGVLGGGGGGEIKIKDRRLGAVASFKYLGAVVSDDGSRPVIHSLGLHKPL